MTLVLFLFLDYVDLMFYTFTGTIKKKKKKYQIAVNGLKAGVFLCEATKDLKHFYIGVCWVTPSCW